MNDIRQKATDLIKAVDDFVNSSQDALVKEKLEIAAAKKELKVMADKAHQEQTEGLAKERALIEKEKLAMRDRTQVLEKQEKDMKLKMDRISKLMES